MIVKQLFSIAQSIQIKIAGCENLSGVKKRSDQDENIPPKLIFAFVIQTLKRMEMNRINIICLGVRSMEKSLSFYKNIGFKTYVKEDNPPIV